MQAPIAVRVLALLLPLFGLLSVVGAFVFVFPLGGWLGPGLGALFLAVGAALPLLAWRLLRGDAWALHAAVALLVLHEGAHRLVNLALEGRIPPEDYPFMALVALMLVLLLLPGTRRFCSRARPG
ncbi:MAG TPA: hypothetical protein VM582_05770 [Candidatus Thermoplasmatota archaeon]|nr:hypothetical protein [Candidatus Thermoplasmatota archaeon]